MDTETDTDKDIDTDISPGRLRDRVLERHGWIRDGLERLRELAGNGSGAVGDDSALSGTRHQCRSLLRMIDEEIAFEKSALDPLLRELDAWGPIRCEDLSLLHTGLNHGAREVSRALNVMGVDSLRIHIDSFGL